MIRGARDTGVAATLVIFDLEFTAWECSMARHWLSPGEFKEVVQIGAVKLDTATLETVAEFDALVRPRVNPELSPYFEALTGISNAQAAREGVDFLEAYRDFAAFAAGGEIAAFGHDEWVLEDNLRLYGIRGAPGLPLFHDLRSWFAGQGIDPRGLHSCDIGPALGVPFAGRIHNALDDARSLAAGLAVMASRGARLRPAA